MNRSYTSPFCTAVWEAISADGGKRTTLEWRGVQAVKDACNDFHEALGPGLDLMAEAGFLNAQKVAPGRTVYWFAADCCVPRGVLPPDAMESKGEYARAGCRMHVPSAMPNEAPEPAKAPPRDEWRAKPSRRGNRLYYRDGRVTDLQGNELEVTQ